MKPSKLLLLLLAILTTNFSLFAQNDSVSYKSQLQFHLINGYSLSYLNLFCPSSGIRFKIDLRFNGTSEDRDNIQNSFDNNPNNPISEEQKFKDNQANSSQNYNLAVNYMWISNIAKEINLYLGIGPLISYSRNHAVDNDETIPSTQNSYVKSFYEATSSSFGLGIQGVIGVECNITEKISMLAEFNLNGTYSWDYWKYNSENQSTSLSRTENTEDGSSWNYGLDNIKIGIAYRF
ncbi:MAG: outer membrane beta-barrel protein [Ignavibacteriales bacterium]|nr:outer membrane beta-barrel protein [Ignavibacteriales bacterium]